MFPLKRKGQVLHASSATLGPGVACFLHKIRGRCHMLPLQQWGQELHASSVTLGQVLHASSTLGQVSHISSATLWLGVACFL